MVEFRLSGDSERWNDFAKACNANAGIRIKLRAQPEATNRRWKVLGRFLRELSVHPFILEQIS